MSKILDNIIDFISNNNIEIHVDREYNLKSPPTSEKLFNTPFEDFASQPEELIFRTTHFLANLFSGKDGKMWSDQINPATAFISLNRDLGLDETTQKLFRLLKNSIKDENYKEAGNLKREIESRTNISSNSLQKIIDDLYEDLRLGMVKSNITPNTFINTSPGKTGSLGGWYNFRISLRKEFENVSQLDNDISDTFPLIHPINITDYILIIKEIMEGKPYRDPNLMFLKCG